jgi:hypothetical protein
MMAERKAVHRARLNHTGRLLDLPNVIGVGDGLRVEGGRRTDEVCLVVLVRRKVPQEGLQAKDMVPARLDDVRTDVIEIGDVRALANRTDRFRPAVPGVSIGHFQITAGTFGAVVRDSETGNPLILSNNHVLANSNEARIGDPILQPGAADGGQREDDTIAQLLRFSPIQFLIEPPTCQWATGLADLANWLARAIGSSHRLQAYQTHPQASNRVDAAVAEPLSADWIKADVLEIGEISGMRPPSLGMSVRKSGRTTGFTLGEVMVMDATITIGYGPSRRARYDGQIVTSAMSAPGDSGSLLVAGDAPQAVGLLFAGSDQATIHNPIEDVLLALDVELP